MITLESVGKVIKGDSVLEDISFDIHPKELVCITGPSGSGKSTILHLLIGAEEATSGKIIIDGVELRSLPPTALQLFRRRVGVVFQDYKLLWNQTVAENVAFPLEVCGIPQKMISKRVEAVLSDLGLLRKAKTMTSALSAGEKARTAIARAIVHNPMILLADERTGNLDAEESAMMINLLQLINKNGTTVVLATHDMSIVDQLQTRTLVLNNGKLVLDSSDGQINTVEKEFSKEDRRIPLEKASLDTEGRKRIKIVATQS